MSESTADILKLLGILFLRVQQRKTESMTFPYEIQNVHAHENKTSFHILCDSQGQSLIEFEKRLF